MKKAILLAAAIMSVSFTSVADDFVIATGSEGGGYERLGHTIANSIGKQARKEDVRFDFEILNTNGSMENIELFNSGDAQAAIVQADALNIKTPTASYKAKGAHIEKVWWLYNIKNKKSDIEDIEGDKKIRMVLIDDSGAVVTMQSFVAEDDGYQVNFDSALYADDFYDAADMVCEGKADGKKIAGLLYVGKSIPAEIAQDFKGCVGIGEATDSDFNDAKDVNNEPLYTNCTIERNQLQGMKGGSWGGQDTVCVRAMVIYSNGFEEKNVNRVIKKGVNKALRGS